MFQNMQTEIGSVLPKVLTRNNFKTIMAYISLNIDEATEIVTDSESA